MRDLQVSPPRFKITKLRFGILGRVNTFARAKVLALPPFLQFIITQKSAKEQNYPASGIIYSFKTACGAQSVLSARGCFALCGGRLKAPP